MWRSYNKYIYTNRSKVIIEFCREYEKKIHIINGIGTDIGKTFITSILIKEEIKINKQQVCVLKPVASGVLNPFESDTSTLLKAAKKEVNEKELFNSTLYFLTQPLSINIAAKHEGKNLLYSEIQDFCLQKIDQAIKRNETIFIEMSGGLCSPITDHETMLELTTSLTAKFPDICNNILVTTDYLGSISHTILCCKAFEFDEIIWNPKNGENTEIKTTIEKFIGKALRII